MKIRACAPSSRAAQATAWPWLPALAATTPASRCSGSRLESLTYAPRILNEPVRCRFSAFEAHRPAREPRERLRGEDRRDARDSVEPLARALDLRKPGCRCRRHRESGTPSRVSLAPQSAGRAPVACTSASSRRSSGSSATACSRWRLRPARRDREHLAREIRPAPLLELPALLEERAMLLDLLPQLRHVLAAHRLREDDRRIPLAALVVMDRASEDRAHLVRASSSRRGCPSC